MSDKPVKVPASELVVGDVIEMYGWGWSLSWEEIKEIRASKWGGTLYFHGRPINGTGRRFDRTCRAVTKIEVRR